MITETTTAEELMSKYPGVSEIVAQTLIDYIVKGIPTGDFLNAVLANDLMESFGRADDYNRTTLFQICRLIYHELPYNSHGSFRRVSEWLESFQNVPQNTNGNAP